MYHRYTQQLWFVVAAATILLLFHPRTASASDTTLWDSASAKVESGDLAGAKELFTKLLREFPSSPKAPGAQLKLAYIKMKASPQSDQEMINAFAEVRTKYPTSPEAADVLARIGYLHSKSNTTLAIADFTAFLTSNPEHRLAGGMEQSLGRLYLKTKDLDKAEASFDKVKTYAGASATMVDEANLQSCFVKIMKFHADKDKAHLTAAIEALGKMNASPRLNTRARADLGIAEALLLQGKAFAARDRYRVAAQAYANSPYFKGFALYGAATCSQTAQDRATAIQEYTTFLNTQTGVILAEKHASWRSVALQSTSKTAQISIQQKGEWDKLPMSDAVQEPAYQLGECLYASARYREAAQLPGIYGS
jgi:TolA-binding protein